MYQIYARKSDGLWLARHPGSPIATMPEGTSDVSGLREMAVPLGLIPLSQMSCPLVYKLLPNR